jgi:hypothetical protein
MKKDDSEVRVIPFLSYNITSFLSSIIKFLSVITFVGALNCLEFVELTLTVLTKLESFKAIEIFKIRVSSSIIKIKKLKILVVVNKKNIIRIK